MAVSPLEQWLVVEPGRVSELSLTVKNVARQPQAPAQPVSIQVVDFAVSADGTLSFGEQFAHDRSAVPWIALDETEFVLEPDQGVQLKGAVRVPAGADGDYWAAVLVTLGNPNREGQVRVVLRTACAVFVRVERFNHVARLDIADLSVALPQFGPSDDASRLAITADTGNEGVISFKASGRAAIYNEARQQVASVPLHARRRRVLPGHRRHFTGLLPSPLP
ncbi:MAG: hypothetical protein ACYS8K_10750, partial [Planctomycetota bacterium]